MTNKPYSRFTNEELVEFWAAHLHTRSALLDTEASNQNKNFWFRNNVLYSYKEPIAYTPNPSNLFLFTNKRFSATTTRHTSLAYTVIRREFPSTPILRLPSPYSPQLHRPDHHVNLLDFRTRLAYLNSMTSIEDQIERIKSLKEEWRIYREEFNISEYALYSHNFPYSIQELHNV